MGLSIGEVAKEFNITTYAIRYYDKLGLLTEIQRDSSGKRCFCEEDMDRLSVISCLKSTGMKMEDIKVFLDLHITEPGCINQKRKMIENQKAILEAKVAHLNEFIEQSEFKLWFFDHLVVDGIEPPYSEGAFQEWKRQYAQWKKEQEQLEK